MAATAQVNARIDPDLKSRGDAALASAGFTPTQAVRALWELAARNADTPQNIEAALYPERVERQVQAEDSERSRKVVAAKKGPLIVEDALASLRTRRSAADAGDLVESDAAATDSEVAGAVPAAGRESMAGSAPVLSDDELKELSYRERYGDSMGWAE